MSADTLKRADEALQVPIDEIEQRIAVLDPDDPLAGALSDQLVELSDRRNAVVLELAVNDGAVTVIRPAAPPLDPNGLPVWVFIGAAALGGLLIGVTIAFVLEALDRRIDV